jgi:hypothetical protein
MFLDLKHKKLQKQIKNLRDVYMYIKKFLSSSTFLLYLRD